MAAEADGAVPRQGGSRPEVTESDLPCYAIVKTGGKQYRVEKGQTLLVERLPDDEGATVDARAAAVAGGEDAVFDADGSAKVRVEAKVVGHERGPKLRVFKFKPKRGYKRAHRATARSSPASRSRITVAAATQKRRGGDRDGT